MPHPSHSPTLTKAYSTSPTPDDSNQILKKLFSVFLLASLIMSVEIAGGIMAGSISVLSDAAHMLSDLLTFVICIASVWISKRPPSSQYSFGLHRAGVLGALFSAFIVLGVTGSLMYYSVVRIGDLDQMEVQGKTMLAVACFGLVCNLLMVKILHGDGEVHSHSHLHCHSHNHHKEHEHKHKHHQHSHNLKKKHNERYQCDEESDCLREYCDDQTTDEDKIEPYSEESYLLAQTKETHSHQGNKHSFLKIMDIDDLNIKVTLLHILGDILQSIGVIITSILISISPDRFKIADPIATFIFAGIVLFTSFRVIKECITILMEGVPQGLNMKALERDLKRIKTVKEIENLRVWSLSAGQLLMTAHLYSDGDSEVALDQAIQICRKHGINDSTIQVKNIKNV